MRFLGALVVGFFVFVAVGLIGAATFIYVAPHMVTFTNLPRPTTTTTSRFHQ